MLKNFIQNKLDLKQNKRKSKSQDQIPVQLLNQVNLTIFLSYDQQINVPVPFKCPLKIINSILTHKVSEFKKQQLIGFESIPSNYSFDYRLHKNLGILNQRKNITLNCLYKNSTLEDQIKKQQQISSNECNLDISTFYKINKYKICKPLSSGGFSRVYLVRSLLNGQLYAAKFMEKNSQVNIDRCQAIRNQFLIHKALNHPYIVKMHQYIETQQFYILIMQYCPGGQLFTLLKNNRYMGQEKAKMIFLQILLAIKYLHQKNIVFRDIKPQNILIDEKGHAKLTDFGLAKQIRGKTNSYCGSVEYMAPQIISKKSYSLDVDLYCMGALLYQILIGCPPFYNPNFTNNETKYHICNSQVCFPNKVTLSEQVKEFIAFLLMKNPNQRLGHLQGVRQVLQHQWIGDVCLQSILKDEVQCPFVPNLDTQNFDRQQDIYERQFRNKIIQDMKNCKKVSASLIVTNKFKFNNQIKIKSRSLGINKKHIKSKFQEEFSRTSSNFENKFSSIKQYCTNLQQCFNKTNPYKFSLNNKQLNQKKTKLKNNVDQKVNIQNPFKKKSLHYRSLSKFTKKNDIEIQKSIKKQIKDILSINSKTYQNSRKNSVSKDVKNNCQSRLISKSLHKYRQPKLIQSKPKFLQQYADKMQFSDKTMKKENQILIKEKTKSHKRIYSLSNMNSKSHKIFENIENKRESLQKHDINQKVNKKQCVSTPKYKIQKLQQIYLTKDSKAKQNIENKGLKRKNLHNTKKKFVFAKLQKQQKKSKHRHLLSNMNSQIEQRKMIQQQQKININIRQTVN